MNNLCSVVVFMMRLFCRYVFFMDIFALEKVEDSVEICVKQCPDQDLYTPQDVRDFYERTGSRLCTYDIDPSQYTDESLYNNGGGGPCPQLPLLVRFVVIITVNS